MRKLFRDLAITPRSLLSSEAVWAGLYGRYDQLPPIIGCIHDADINKRGRLWVAFTKFYLTQYPNTLFLLVGSNAVTKTNKTLMQDHKIADKVICISSLRDLDFWLSKMDVLIQPTDFGGLPHALRSAQKAGVPVVSVLNERTEGCFRDGRTGLSLRESDTPPFLDLSAKVQRVLHGTAGLIPREIIRVVSQSNTVPRSLQP